MTYTRMHVRSHVYVHEQCALWSPEVGRDRRGFYNVLKAVRRGRLLRCSACKRAGATIGCQVKTCKVTMHFQCCTGNKMLDVCVCMCTYKV
jgi:hypothetical protein